MESALVARNLPTVTICEAVRDPKRYNKKVIRIEAIYLVYYHGAYLYGSKCNQPNLFVDPSITCRNEQDESCQELQHALDKLVEPYLRWNDTKSSRASNVVIVGRFRRVHKIVRTRSGDTLVRSGPNEDLRFELRIIRPESASPIRD